MTTGPGSRTALRVGAAALASWWVATAFMSYVAGANFGALKVDHVRAEDVFGSGFDPAHAELALRYLAGEINRVLFTVYGWAQLVLGLVAVGAVWRGVRGGWIVRGATVVSFALAVLFLVWLVPTIVEAGQVIDFQPREPVTPEREAFDRLHHVSVAVESSKLLLLLVALVGVVRHRES